jgi:nitrogen regulatory protein PII
VVVRDDQVNDIVHKIVEQLGSPKVGGKIFVVDIPTVVDLATKEQGEKAL